MEARCQHLLHQYVWHHLHWPISGQGPAPLGCVSSLGSGACIRLSL